jgi:hypothetical protein
LPQWLPFFDPLAKRCELLVPEHPGFGGSDDPPWIRSIQDLAELRDAGSARLQGRLLNRCFLNIGHDHIRTGLGECSRNAQTDAGSSAGDDGCLARDVHSRGALKS